MNTEGGDEFVWTVYLRLARWRVGCGQGLGSKCLQRASIGLRKVVYEDVGRCLAFRKIERDLECRYTIYGPRDVLELVGGWAVF